MGNIYIEVGKDNVVTKIHRFPFDPTLGLQATKEELEQTGYFVNSIPEPQQIVGRRAVPKYNPDQKEVYYDYVSVPLSDKERLDLIEGAINDIVMGRI